MPVHHSARGCGVREGAGTCVGSVGGAGGRQRGPQSAPHHCHGNGIADEASVALPLRLSSGRDRQGQRPGALDEQFPVDVSVDGAAGSALPVTMGERIGGVDRVTAVAELSRGEVSTAAGKELTVTGVDPAEAAAALRVPITLPRSGQMWFRRELLERAGRRAQASRSTSGRGRRPEPELTAVEGTEGPPPLMVREDLAAVTANPAADSLWIRFADGLTDDEIATAQREVTALATDIVPTAEIGGAVAMRAALNSVLDTMLMIVVGLLSVAILIAVIGVGNTMALSVIERSAGERSAAVDRCHPGRTANPAVYEKRSACRWSRRCSEWCSGLPSGWPVRPRCSASTIWCCPRCRGRSWWRRCWSAGSPG